MNLLVLWLGGLLVGLGIGVQIGMQVEASFTIRQIMQEAFDRGYAVECLGKEGYYWKCEQ